MKKTTILLMITLVASGLFYSCNDELDLPTDGRIDLEQVFTDYNRTRGYINSTYGYVPNPHIDRSSYTDEAQDARAVLSGSNFRTWYDANVTAENFNAVSPDGNAWGRLYEGIRKCNVFLENIEDATALVSEEEKLGWIAQVRTLRALYYLQLIKRYGGVPIVVESLGVDHDFSQDSRASFSEVVTFILDECNAALAAPEASTPEAFSWEIYDNQFQIMTRAVAYAIKSQAVTYAASSLWSDGTYTWADATEITAEALEKTLANGYELFNEEPSGDAFNAYGLYFITSSNDQRSRDKETIYQAGNQLEIWKYAGLPTNPGMETAGPNPTQNLVDSYEMANGEPAILGYNDSDHLDPIFNAASGYDENNPYEGRDPRFYASIYYNGAIKNLNQITAPRADTYDLALTPGANQLDVTEVGDGSYELTTTGGDPNVMLTPLAEGLNNPPSVVFTFEYKSSADIDPQIYFGPALAEDRSIHPATIAQSADWSTYSIDITSPVSSFGWGNVGDNLRFDFGTNSGVAIDIRDMAIEVISSPDNPNADRVETFTGGAEELRINDDSKYTSTGYYLRKYNHNLSGVNNQSDGAVRLFRLAELYLNFAEAAYQSMSPDAVVTHGGLSMSARDAVSVVRERAGMPAFPVGMSPEDFQEKYRNERRIELAFEEHRYFDVRRWEILQETDDFVTGMEIEKTNTGFDFNRFKVEERDNNAPRFLRYPINQSEVNKIFGTTGEDWQNPGW